MQKLSLFCILVWICSILQYSNAQCTSSRLQTLSSNVANFKTVGLVTHSGSYDPSAAVSAGYDLQFAPETAASLSLYLTKKINIAKGFTTSFVYKMTHTDTNMGFAYLIQNLGVTARGGSGWNLGYNFLNNIAVEFDASKQNSNDGSGAHICINSASASSANTPTFSSSFCKALPNSFSNADVSVVIEFTTTTSNSGTLVATATVGNTSVSVSRTFAANLLASLFDTPMNAWTGFTTSSADTGTSLVLIKSISISTSGVSKDSSSLLNVNNNAFSIRATDSHTIANTFSFQLRDNCNAAALTTNTLEVDTRNTALTATWAKTTGDVSTTFSVVLENKENGTWDVKIWETVTGSYRLTLLLNNASVVVYTVTITPDAVSSIQSTFTSPSSFVAGVAGNPVVTLRDRFSNLYTLAGVNVAARFGCCDDLTVVSTANSAGTVSLSVSSSVAAVSSTLEFKVNSVQISNSPQTVVVNAAAAHGPSSTLSGDGLVGTTAGTNKKIYLTYADIFNNAIIADPGQTVMTFQSQDGSALANGILTVNTMTWNSVLNVQELSYTFSKSGNYKFVCTVNGIACKGSENFIISISAGPVDGSKTTVIATSAVFKAGQTTIYDITAKDTNDNVLMSASSSPMTVSVESGTTRGSIDCLLGQNVSNNPDIESMSCIFHTSGVYRVSIVHKAVYVFTIKATIAGASVSSAAYTSVPGDVDLTKSSAGTAFPTSVVAGAEMVFTYKLMDKYSNAVSNAHALLSARIARDDAGYFAFKQNIATSSNGADSLVKFSISTASTAYTATVLYAGAILNTLPFSVVPGAYDAASSSWSGIRNYVTTGETFAVVLTHSLYDAEKNLITSIAIDKIKYSFDGTGNDHNPATATFAMEATTVSGEARLSRNAVWTAGTYTFSLYLDAVSGSPSNVPLSPIRVVIAASAQERFGTLQTSNAVTPITAFTTTTFNLKAGNTLVGFFVDRILSSNSYVASGVNNVAFDIVYYEITGTSTKLSQGISSTLGSISGGVLPITFIPRTPGTYMAQIFTDNLVTVQTKDLATTAPIRVVFNVAVGDISAQSELNSIAATVVGNVEFEFIPKDLNFNLIQDLTDNLIGVVSTATFVNPPTIRKNASGSYSVIGVIRRAGLYSITVSYNGVGISSRDFDLAASTPTRAAMVLSDQATCYAGSRCSIVAGIFDTYDNIVTSSAYAYTVSLDSTALTGLETVTEANSNHLFSFTRTAIFLGTVSVSYNGASIGTMARYEILPDRVPATVTSVMTPPTNSQPGSGTLVISAVDKYGNVWYGPVFNYEITRSIEGVASTISTTNIQLNTIYTNPTDVMPSSRTASVFIAFQQAGTYTINGAVAGVSLSTPHTVVVNAGAVAPRRTVVTLGYSRTEPIAAGSTSTFDLRLNDNLGNLITSDSVLASTLVNIKAFEGVYGCSGTLTPVVVPNMSTEFNGYTLTKTIETVNSIKVVRVAFTTNRANSFNGSGRRAYYFSILVNNVYISNCGEQMQVINIKPASINYAKSLISGIDSRGIEAGTLEKFTLNYYDSFGNALLISEAAVDAKYPPASFKVSDCTFPSTPGSSAYTQTKTEITDGDYAGSVVTFGESESFNDAGNSFFSIEVTDKLAATTLVLDSVTSNVCIPLNIIPTFPDYWDIYDVSLGSVSSPTSTGLPSFTSGTPLSLYIRAFDKFDNLLDFTVAETAAYHTSFYFNVVFTYQSGNSDAELVYVASARTQIVAGQVTVLVPDFRIDWYGKYNARVVIVDTILRTRKISSVDYTVDVKVPICTDATNKYFDIVSGTCVAAYPTAAITCLTSTAPDVYSSVTDVTLCVCRSGEKVCANGNNRYCIPNASICPSAFSPSTANSGSSIQCVPGLTLCPDLRSCVANVATCPPAPVAGFCNSKYFCPDGSCVGDALNCPQVKTCPGSQVLCPDGSCAATLSTCKAPRFCAVPTPFVCADGSCAVDSTTCPNMVTCPVGKSFCANGLCQDVCTTAPTLCPANMYRCNDGTCTQDIVFCPTKKSCPIDKILCPDQLTCEDNANQCNLKSRCSADKPILCSSGACVVAIEQCPTTVTCSATYPILCSDNRCVKTRDLCNNNQGQCPVSTPVRCIDGTCQKSQASCGTDITCPSYLPVRCADRSCKASVNDCRSDVGLVDAFACIGDTVACPGGGCAKTSEDCATTRACSTTEVRCADGSCRTNCANVVLASCSSEQVQCPLYNGGIVCRKSLADCPQSVVCPAEKPVKCADASCASSQRECAELNSDLIPSARVACGAGTWASSQSLCGTPITCPSATPIKCWDESCRVSKTDCPPMKTCPSSKPFVCADGSCQTNAWSCSITRCTDADLPVRCSAHNSNGRCVASIENCPNVQDLMLDLSVKCPNGQRCWDGSCVAELRLCPARKCPPNTPALCSNGQCAASYAQCTPTVCSGTTPHYCAKTNSCGASACNTSGRVCATGLTVCTDGSCRTASECASISSNGCPSATPHLCFDKQCAVAAADCTEASDTYNACPASRPFRCDGGACVATSRVCPSVSNRYAGLTSHICGASVLCDDGACATSYAACRTMRPCEKGQYRCGDGACKPFGCDPLDPTCRNEASSAFYKPDFGATCSGANTCPTALPYRCQDGGCAKNQDQCVDDHPIKLSTCCNGNRAPLAATSGNPYGTCSAAPGSCETTRLGLNTRGCPIGTTACENGVCVATNDVATICPFYTQVSAKNGCDSATPIRCSNDQCVDDQAKCLLFNGCPSSNPYLNNAGVCVASAPTFTSAAVACSGVTCPNGHCKPTIDECTMHNGCPIAKPNLCADGTCAATLAGTAGDTTLGQCKPTVKCSVSKPYLCGDGTCATSFANCPAVLPCGTVQPTQCGFACPSNPTKCAIFDLVGASCPFVQSDVEAQCGELTSCPASKPLLCTNGECVKSISECTSSVAVATRVETCPVGQMRCATGVCVSTALECVAAVSQLNHGTSGIDISDTSATLDPLIISDPTLDNNVCPGKLVPCADGSCVADMTKCPVVAACPRDHLRCSDGSCINIAATPSLTCPPVKPCPANSSRCLDGLCRNTNRCPLATGCGLSRPFHCSDLKVQCTTDYTACHGTSAFEVLLQHAEIRKAQGLRAQKPASYAKVLTTTTQEVCAVNCERDVPATSQTVTLYPGMNTKVDVSVNDNLIARTTVTVPAGAFSATSSITINPVPSSLFDGSTSNNGIQLPFTFSRSEVVGGQTGVFASVILSSPFHCSTVGVPTQPLVVNAFIDSTTFTSSTSSTIVSNVPCDIRGTLSGVVDLPNAARCPIDLTITPTIFTSVAHAQYNNVNVDPDCLLYNYAGTVDSVSTLVRTDDSATYEVCIAFTSYNRMVQVSSLDASTVSMVSQKMCVYLDRVQELVYIGHPSQFLSATATLEDLQVKPTSSSTNTVTALLAADSTRCVGSNSDSNEIQTDNICLARYTNSGTWECLFDRNTRLANRVRSDDNGPNEVSAALASCSANAYAFAHIALPAAVFFTDTSRGSSCWICDNWVYLVIGLGAFVLVLIVVVICCIRFYRNRIAFKKEQEKLHELQDRAKELHEYGGGFGVGDADGEVIMVANPLVLEMQNLHKQLEAANVAMGTQSKQEEYEIQRLEMQRQRIKEEIRRIEGELQAQQLQNAAQGPKPVFVSANPTGPITTVRTAAAPIAPSGAAMGPTAVAHNTSAPMPAPKKRNM